MREYSSFPLNPKAKIREKIIINVFFINFSLTLIFSKINKKNMNRKLIRYIIAICVLLVTVDSSFTYQKTKKNTLPSDISIKKKLDSLIHIEMPEVFVGVKIVNLSKNKVIYQINQDKLFRPASNQKLITTAAALEYLPENFTFKTEIIINGELIDTILNGDLCIKGYGDPLFKIGDLDSIINFLIQKNIKIISGNLIGDVSYFDDVCWGRGWMWDDEFQPYTPYISPLSINSNTIELIITPAKIVGEKALINIKPENDFFKLSNNILTATSEETTNINITRIDKQEILIYGKIPIDSEGKEQTISIPEPEIFFLNLLKERLEKNRIKILGKILIDTIKNGSCIFSISRSIDSVMSKINKNSDNLSAENLFKTLSAELLSKGTQTGSVSIIKKFLIKADIDTNRVVIADGSGVSRYNLLSPESLIKVIKYFYTTDAKKFSRLYNSLSISGIDGTLKNRFNNKRIAGKTGTHTDATTLCGFFKNKSNDLILFSIMINNYPPFNSSKINKYKLMEEKIIEIVDY